MANLPFVSVEIKKIKEMADAIETANAEMVRTHTSEVLRAIAHSLEQIASEVEARCGGKP
jgi:hypothetical protein